MRIGLSTTMLEPSRNGGRKDGIGVYTSYLMAGMRKLGESVLPFSFPGYGVRGQLRTGHSLGVPFAVAGAASLGSGSLWRLNPPVDVYHATDYRVLAMRCPVIATLYDAIPMANRALANDRMRGLKNIVMRRLARHADRIIAISEHAVAELVEHYRVDDSRIRIIHCGVDRAWLQPPDAAVSEEVLSNRRLKPGYFLTVGTLQPRKNIEAAVAAHARLPASIRTARPLVVVGRPGWHCDRLIALLREKEAVGDVRWLADVADEGELRALYAAASVFIFPSLHEGFGLPVLEAFASGVPVVATNATAVPEVSAGIAIEVDPLSTTAIADGMCVLAENTRERQWRITAGRKRAAEMSWDAMVARTRAVYREVL